MQEISLNILDIAQNSVAAGAATIGITVDEQPESDLLTVTVEDDGCGMTEEQVRAVTDPFYTTRKTRKVGLGVPLFKMAAEMSGGRFRIDSRKGSGTAVAATFALSNIDRMPLGDINGTILLLISCNPSLTIIYRRVYGGREFTLDTREIKKKIGDVPISNGEVLEWIKEYLAENEKETAGGNGLE